ncbi:protein PNG1 [Colletotrichum limetticola]|uniref:Protein PNG1 n=1 Tax=Colletotrichum limetticola TaxID=1209924 RepID=A0ABQ9PAM9_9PEZI|nr:protein PNG1 [Colletotrichum limetticola]
MVDHSGFDTPLKAEFDRNENPRSAPNELSSISDGIKTKLTATVGGLVSFHGRLMFLTVQPFPEETITPINAGSLADGNGSDEESDDCELTGWSDFENDDDDDSALLDTIADEASTISSIPAPAEPAKKLQSGPQDLMPSTEQEPSMDQHSGAIATGEVVFSSKELFYALVEVSPSVLLQLGDERAHAQAVPLESYLDYVESAPCDAAVEVTTPEGRSIGGTLSGTPTSCRPPGRRDFIQVYSAKLNSPIASGEYGSWLRNAKSRKIYGHVFSVKLLGNETMVVPAHQVLRQALEKLSQNSMNRTADLERHTEYPGCPSEKSATKTSSGSNVPQLA